MSNGDLHKAALELAQLQREYLEYMRAHEFRYEEYSNPPPGGFMERYKKRTVELAHELGAMPLDHPES